MNRPRSTIYRDTDIQRFLTQMHPTSTPLLQQSAITWEY